MLNNLYTQNTAQNGKSCCFSFAFSDILIEKVVKLRLKSELPSPSYMEQRIVGNEIK